MTKTPTRSARPKQRKPADPGAMWRVIHRLEPFSANELLRLELPVRMSFQAMRSGAGQEQDFHDLAAVVNVTIMRSRSIDPLCEQTANMASDALMRCWDRHQRTGIWGFDGLALGQIEAAIELHEQLVRLSTPEQMMASARRVTALRAQARQQQQQGAAAA